MSTEFDYHTRRHFTAWLKQFVPARDRGGVRKSILALLAIDPGLLAGRSWPELRALSERSVEVVTARAGASR